MENTGLADVSASSPPASQSPTSTPAAPSNYGTVAHSSASYPNSQLGIVAPPPTEEQIVDSDATKSSKKTASTRSSISSIAPSSDNRQSDKPSIRAVSNVQSYTPAIGTSSNTPVDHTTTRQSTTLVDAIQDAMQDLPIEPSTDPESPLMSSMALRACIEEWANLDDSEVPDWRTVEV